MKASELKIGNFISDGHFQYKVFEITIGVIKGFSSLNGNIYPDSLYSLNTENIQGIPLTEEWLKKFGFEVFPWGWVHSTLKDRAVLIRFSKDKYWIELGNGLRIDLPHVHTLQNFFALTGEELTTQS